MITIVTHEKDCVGTRLTDSKIRYRNARYDNDLFDRGMFS
jgi:hypothetical protein